MTGFAALAGSLPDIARKRVLRDDSMLLRNVVVRPCWSPSMCGAVEKTAEKTSAVTQASEFLFFF